MGFSNIRIEDSGLLYGARWRYTADFSCLSCSSALFAFASFGDYFSLSLHSLKLSHKQSEMLTLGGFSD